MSQSFVENNHLAGVLLELKVCDISQRSHTLAFDERGQVEVEQAFVKTQV
ncbi:hypothetical protein [Alkalihalobacterium elongatum]|nr:hypothetical protein [Alkalihalobacterium elongatum]